MLLGIPTPLCAIAYLAWQGQAALGFCTLAPYLLQLLTQIISEGVFMKQSMPSCIVGLILPQYMLPMHCPDCLLD